MINDHLKQVTKEECVNLGRNGKIGVDPLPSPATPASLIDSYFGSNPPQISLTAVQFVNSLKNPNIKQVLRN